MTTTEDLTPAQKAAKTRAANKAKAALAAKSLEETAAPVVKEVIDTIEAAGESKFLKRTISRVTPKFSARVRDFIYSAGIVLGVIGAAAGAVQGFLSGDAQYIAAVVGAISLSLTNALAKLNLSKTAEEVATAK